MFAHSWGFVFDARKDSSDKIGVLESYEYFNGHTKVTFGVTQNGSISGAIYCDKHLGFLPLSNIVKNEDDANKFIRSRRGIYTVVGHSMFIGMAKVKVNGKGTPDCSFEVENLDLFVPIGDSTNEGKPVIICDKVGVVEGLHRHIVSEKVYNGYLTKVTSELLKYPLDDKAKYFLSRC